jgi:carbamoyltransferase
MLYTAPAKNEFKDALRVITDYDGSARKQTERDDTSPLHYQSIKAFGDRTGISLLLNPSFTRRGEPIVTILANAFAIFNGSGLDFLLLGRCMVCKT